jgi:putative hydrolase of the HAD superfamily
VLVTLYRLYLIGSNVKYAAVIFDLFGTLVDNFSLREHEGIVRQMAAVVSAPSDGFLRLWLDTFNERATGIFPNPEANIGHICSKLGVQVEEAKIKQSARLRFDYEARSMTPRADALEVLSNLKSRGYKTGLISDSSAEAPVIWKETPFAPLIDVAVFSCLVGFRKPNPQIYHLAAKHLGVEPQACLYIGDGSSQELTGANGVGMHAVLLSVPDDNPADTYRIDRDEWSGPVISSLKQVVTLLTESLTR